MATAYTMTSYQKWFEPRNQLMDLNLLANFTPASLALNDTYKFFYIHPNMILQGISIIFPAMDSGSTLTIDLGDSSSATLFLSADTTAQAGGTKVVTAGVPKVYTSADFITMKAHAAANTPSLSEIKVIVTVIPTSVARYF